MDFYFSLLIGKATRVLEVEFIFSPMYHGDEFLSQCLLPSPSLCLWCVYQLREEAFVHACLFNCVRDLCSFTNVVLMWFTSGLLVHILHWDLGEYDYN